MTAGQFLYDNYHQALKIINEEGPLLEEFSEKHGLDAMSYEMFLQDERAYLDGLKSQRPPPEEVEVAYIRALEALETVE